LQEKNNMTTSEKEVEAQCRQFREVFLALRGQVAKVIVGHEGVVDDVLIALFGGGHVLLEGVPGLGKTLLVRTLSQAFSLEFRRIQFTPDLMPADIVGTNIVMEDAASGRREFQFQKGPIFGQIILADEINRATPKTQSAMLEAMRAFGHQRWPDPPVALAVHGAGDTEPDRAGRHVSAARGATGPVLFQTARRLQRPSAAQDDPRPDHHGT